MYPVAKGEGLMLSLGADAMVINFQSEPKKHVACLMVL
jgi:hypothetical protein